MKDRVLYLLGAGASCEVIPLVSEFTTHLNSFATDLQNAGPKTLQGDPDPSPDDKIWLDGRQRLVESIQWLSQEASVHASVDTFAKKLFFRRDSSKLKQLKATLSVYLIIEQSRSHVDKRYDSFLASVLDFDKDRRIKLSEKLCIITWNYNTQLEKAVYGFCEDKDLVIKLVTFNERVYHINGYCGTHPPGHIGEAFQAVWNQDGKAAWETGIRLYEEYISDNSTPEPDIRFAWEYPTQQFFKNTALQLEQVATVVVIGYSFPYFNREIDRQLFNQLSNIKRIYLQYPDGVHKSIEERLKTLNLQTDDIVYITGTDLFYIPDEF